MFIAHLSTSEKQREKATMADFHGGGGGGGGGGGENCEPLGGSRRMTVSKYPSVLCSNFMIGEHH